MRGARDPSITHAVYRTGTVDTSAVRRYYDNPGFLISHVLLFLSVFVDMFHPTLGLFRDIGTFRPPAFQDLRAGAGGRGRPGPAVQEAGAYDHPPRTDGRHGGQGKKQKQDRCACLFF